MKIKLAALIISVCLFICAMQSAGFFRSFSSALKIDNAKISCAQLRLMNILDAPENIMQGFLGFSKDAFYAASAGGSSGVPLFFSKTALIVITSVLASFSFAYKKAVFFSNVSFSVYKPFKDFMRRKPLFDLQKATPIYLLCIDAIHKGSAPAAFLAVSNNKIAF
jgi:hypothetical protein